MILFLKAIIWAISFTQIWTRQTSIFSCLFVMYSKYVYHAIDYETSSRSSSLRYTPLYIYDSYVTDNYCKTCQSFPFCRYITGLYLRQSFSLVKWMFKLQFNEKARPSISWAEIFSTYLYINYTHLLNYIGLYSIHCYIKEPSILWVSIYQNFHLKFYYIWILLHF